MKKTHYLNWFLVVFWMGIIFYLSHQPAGASRSLSEGLLSNLLHIFPQEHSGEIELLHILLRKSAHFIAYFLLAILLFRAMIPNRMSVSAVMRQSSSAWFICIVYAASDEFHQTFVSGRSGEFRDVMIDSFGALLGILISNGIFWWRTRRKHKTMK